MKNFKTSKKAQFVLIVSMFAVMLALNMLTKLVSDDFQYSFSFVDEERITKLSQIIPSVIAHGKLVNGRYFSHAVAQLFIMLPPIVFDLVNTSVFVLTVLMTYKMSGKRTSRDNLLLLGIFGAIWLFEQDFGQVNLWLDGSCNYLFAVFFGLIFLWPYINSFMYGKSMPWWLVLPHLLVSVWLGGYLEMMAVGCVCAAVFFVGTDVIYFKKYRSLIFIPSILASLFGFAIMALAPMQTTNKLSEFSFLNMITTLGVAMLMLASIFPIIILYVHLFKRALKEKCDVRIILTSLIVALGALAANFVLVFARYYALRCSVAFIFLSIFATAILYSGVKDRAFGEVAKKWGRVFLIFLIAAIVVAFADNIYTFAVMEQNEALIEKALENGDTVITLTDPFGLTKYNSHTGIIYLSDEGTDAWPNQFFAKYYGLEGVVGKNKMKEIFGASW